ncbi:hypothetical protein F7725_010851 [Dissostichus mawsoni]|uniref:Uncharacterized protein n=1 Tax=Dissostichus mawsoni TaxID=36200 RepID=A0A7J5Z7S5_DISMA|nr:hypothetical protein F7725_010851 [Dissostichus mawsoni]
MGASGLELGGRPSRQEEEEENSCGPAERKRRKKRKEIKVKKREKTKQRGRKQAVRPSTSPRRGPLHAVGHHCQPLSHPVGRLPVEVLHLHAGELHLLVHGELRGGRGLQLVLVHLQGVGGHVEALLGGGRLLHGHLHRRQTLQRRLGLRPHLSRLLLHPWVVGGALPHLLPPLFGGALLLLVVLVHGLDLQLLLPPRGSWSLRGTCFPASAVFSCGAFFISLFLLPSLSLFGSVFPAAAPFPLLKSRLSFPLSFSC